MNPVRVLKLNWHDKKGSIRISDCKKMTAGLPIFLNISIYKVFSYIVLLHK